MDLSRQRIIVARSMREVRLVTIEPRATGISILKMAFIIVLLLSS